MYLDRDHRLALLLDDAERQKLLVLLDGAVLVTTTDQTLHIEQRLGGVDGGLVLGGLANQTLVIRERDVGRSNAVTLIVGDDLDAAVLVDADARVRGAQIDADHGAVDLLVLGRGEADQRSKEELHVLCSNY